MSIIRITRRSTAFLASLRRALARDLVKLRASYWACRNPRAAADISSENAWLLGGASGRIYSDNGAALHQYLIRKHPEIPVYWVIDRDSPDVSAATAAGPVLFRDDPMTYVRSIRARVLILSHGVHDIPGFASRSTTALRVRLTHGIFALKKSSPPSGTRSADSLFDLVIAASAFDKANKAQWNIANDKLVVTGIARFDRLLALRRARPAQSRRRLLYMPTWRDDAGAEMRQGILAFVEHPDLQRILKDQDAELTVFLHMNIADSVLREALGTIGGRVLLSNLHDPQPLFAKSDMMVTDYSSVTFDMLYLSSPVLFYRFDRTSFATARGSYISDDELPGPIAETADDIIALIGRYLDADPILARDLDERIATWRAKAFDFYDDCNCARIVAAIEQRIAKDDAN